MWLNSPLIEFTYFFFLNYVAFLSYAFANGVNLLLLCILRCLAHLCWLFKLEGGERHAGRLLLLWQILGFSYQPILNCLTISFLKEYLISLVILGCIMIILRVLLIDVVEEFAIEFVFGALGGLVLHGDWDYFVLAVELSLFHGLSQQFWRQFTGVLFVKFLSFLHFGPGCWGG